jgi:Fur family iron response transcriptional regulator
MPALIAMCCTGQCAAIDLDLRKSYILKCEFNAGPGAAGGVRGPGAPERGEMLDTLSLAKRKVRTAGLRPTRQRVALADLLFAKGDRHLSAEELHEEAVDAGVPVSLATVYNTLHQFTEAGMLRILAVEGAKTYFDTNTSDHHHYFIEGESRVVDIPSGPVTVHNLPEPPDGMEIVNVDIVVRLRPRRGG